MGKSVLNLGREENTEKSSNHRIVLIYPCFSPRGSRKEAGLFFYRWRWKKRCVSEDQNSLKSSHSSSSLLSRAVVQSCRDNGSNVFRTVSTYWFLPVALSTLSPTTTVHPFSPSDTPSTEKHSPPSDPPCHCHRWLFNRSLLILCVSTRNKNSATSYG